MDWRTEIEEITEKRKDLAKKDSQKEEVSEEKIEAEASEEKESKNYKTYEEIPDKEKKHYGIQ